MSRRVPTVAPLQVRTLDRKVRARCQAHEILRPRQREGFIEIIDAPDEAALGVTPGAEVLDVQVTDCEDLG